MAVTNDTPTVKIRLDVQNTEAITKLQQWATAQNTATSATNRAAKEQGAGLASLNAELRAGVVSREQYVSKVIDLSKKEGVSQTQLVRLYAAAKEQQDRIGAERVASREKEAKKIDAIVKGEQKSLETARKAAEREYDHMARNAEQASARQVRAVGKAIAEEEAARKRGGAFAQAIRTSRFSLPGVGGSGNAGLQPLVGRTGDALGLSGNVVAGIALATNAAAGGAMLAFSEAKRAIGLAADSEKALNQLQFQAKATGAEMAVVSQRARELGADITLPATSSVDATHAILEMSKAGFNLQNSMDSARGSLALAAAAEISAGEAANITASQLKAFGLEGKDAGRVADLLAASANNSLGEIGDMAQAAQQAATVFHQARFSIEDMATDIALMANAGIKGSDAGTSLKTAVQALIAPTDTARKTMKALNIELYDQAGNLRSHDEIIKRVSAAVGNLSEEQRNFALRTIFGSDAIRAANVIFAAGTKKIDEMRATVVQTGVALDTAASKNKGLAGSIDALKSTVDTFEEKYGSRFLDPLTRGVGIVTNLVGALDKLIDRQDKLVNGKSATGAGNDAPEEGGFGGWGPAAVNSARAIYQGIVAAGEDAAKQDSPEGRVAQARIDAGDFRRFQQRKGSPWGQTGGLLGTVRGYVPSMPEFPTQKQLDDALKVAIASADKTVSDYVGAPHDAPGYKGDSAAQLKKVVEADAKRNSPTVRNAALAALQDKTKKAAADKAKREAEKAQREREKAERKAEQERDKAAREAAQVASDNAAGDMEAAQRAVSALQNTYDVLLATQKGTLNPVARASQRELLLRLSDQITTAGETAAEAAHRAATTGDKGHSRAADERRKTTLTVELPKDNRDRLKAIDEAQEAAKKKVVAVGKDEAEAAQKRAEEDKKRREEISRVLGDQLDAEVRLLELARDSAITFEAQTALTQQIFGRAIEKLQNQFWDELHKGDPAAFVNYMAGQGEADAARDRELKSINDARYAQQAAAYDTRNMPAAADVPTVGRNAGANKNATGADRYQVGEDGKTYDTATVAANGQGQQQVNAVAVDALRILTNAASQESGNFLHALLSGGDGARNATRGLVKNLTSQLSSGLADILKKNLIDDQIKRQYERLGDLIAKGGKTAGAAIGQSAISLYNAANLLGQNGKKKQTGALIGGILGFAAGSILPGVGNMAGAQVGAAIGGSFASGGVAPGRKISLIHANELVMPEADLRVLPADVSQRLLTGRDATGGSGRDGVNFSYVHQHYGDVNDRADRQQVAHDFTSAVADYATATGQG